MDSLQALLNPPIWVLAVGLALLLIVLWTKLQRAHFGLLLCSTMLAFAAGEIALRYLQIGKYEPMVAYDEDRPADKDAEYPYEPHGRLIYTYSSNPRSYFDQDNRVTGSINSRGFRGEEADLIVQNDTIRIAVLGDSFALGFGVRDEDTLPVRLQAELNTEQRLFEVLNFGSTDTDTTDQIRLLEDYVLSFRPDVVVVVLFLNDAARFGTLSALAQPQVFRNIRQRSFFLNGLLNAVERRILHGIMIRHYRASYTETNPRWESVQQALRRAKSLATQNEFQLLVAVHPVLFRLDEDYPFLQAHETIRRFCSSEHIAVFDLLEVFKGRVDAELWVHHADQHPNEVAHGLAGKALADYLNRESRAGDEARPPAPIP